MSTNIKIVMFNINNNNIINSFAINIKKNKNFN